MYFIIKLLCNSHKYVFVKHMNKCLKCHVTHMTPILMIFFLFFQQNYVVLLFAFPNFLTFWFHCLFLHFDSLQVFAKHKLGRSTIYKTGKSVFNEEFVTVTNTLHIKPLEKLWITGLLITSRTLHFLYFQHGFRSSCATENHLMFPYFFNRSLASPTVSLNILMTFDMVWHEVLLNKFKSWNFGWGIWPYFVILQ